MTRQKMHGIRTEQSTISELEQLMAVFGIMVLVRCSRRVFLYCTLAVAPQSPQSHSAEKVPPNVKNAKEVISSAHR